MAGGGRISLLIESPLTTLAQAMLGLDGEVKRQIGAATKSAAEPIWRESVRANALTRLQTRLSDSARVGVTAQNVFLRAGGVGRLSSGTPIAEVTGGIEFGAAPTSVVTVKRGGTTYTRRLGNTFGPPRSRGKVAYPAVRAGIPRFAALWIQTAARVVHELIEGVGRG